HVLIVEDAPEFQQIFQQVLTSEGYRVSTADSGERALEMARSLDPDVVVLDLVLPGIDGIDVCRQLRTFSDAYVLMVTSRSDEVDMLIGLAVGADDYLTKPFRPRELVARIGVVLRRPRNVASSRRVTELGDLRVDLESREVHVADKPVALTKIEFDLLAALAENETRVQSRAALLDAVWGENWVGDPHVVDVHIANLRHKIDRSGRKHIRTVRGVGYRMAPVDSENSEAA
ncbi:MAG: response regulator transcription factor, partial [Acidimicrobiia bacterium]|nr:response regulator transcription factor [Acidimicrobiia bacterium]